MTELPTIHQALAQVKKAVGNVSKSQRNSQQGFNFRGIDDVVNAASGPLNDNGVITVPRVESFNYEVVEIGRNKTMMGHYTALVEYSFVGPAGDSVTAKVLAESMDSGDKGAAKVMSVAYRIALLQVLNLPTDAPDPDLDSYERSGSESAVKTTPAGRASAPKATPESRSTDAVTLSIPALVQKIKDATTSDELNSVWKQAGALGALQKEGAVGVTIQQMMYDKGDQIKSAASSNGSPGRKAAK